MSYLMNNQQKLNDILFANRNKQYGAYAIRSTYGNTLFKSIGFMVLGFGSFILIAYYLSNHNNIVDPHLNDGQLTPDPKLIYTTFKLPEPEPEPEAPSQARSTTPASPAEVTELNAHTTVIDTLRNETVVTTEHQVVSTNTAPATEVTGTGNFSTSITSTGTAIPPSTGSVIPMYSVDSQPEYDGGLKALYNFVGSHLKYPEPASDAGRGGTVYVRFVVSESGQVTNLVLLNSMGFGMDEEALRVVSIIPKFKTPAKVNGQPVKTYFQLPIKFSHRQ
ncbi:MAG: TonB family protein [Bacteroidia bacterium]|nr:TonB family protein [Bacteroidia bacterium]